MRKAVEKTRQPTHRGPRARISSNEWANIARRRHTGESISGIAHSYGVTSATIRSALRRAEAAEQELGNRHPEQPASEAIPVPAGTTYRSPLADRLQAAIKHCCGVLDELGEALMTTDDLKAAIHEIRRAIAAIEIEAAKGRHRRYPARAEPTGAVPGEDRQPR